MTPVSSPLRNGSVGNGPGLLKTQKISVFGHHCDLPFDRRIDLGGECLGPRRDRYSQVEGRNAVSEPKVRSRTEDRPRSDDAQDKNVREQLVHRRTRQPSANYSSSGDIRLKGASAEPLDVTA
jgi:hypothetical protein